jgi:4-hydroxythreonine-4-phosphate dehydrogenase
MENNKIRVGITEGDINGVGYEVILKTFADPAIFELCTPIIYGSPKVATYHRKALNLTTNFTTIESASSAYRDRLNIVNCNSDDIKVEFGKTDPEAGEASYQALEKAVDEYKSGYIDVIVTAPINKKAIHSEKFNFAGHTEYFEKELGNGDKALMILMNGDFRVALVTNHLPVRDIAPAITKELVQSKINIFNRSLKQDFSIEAPRIAVMSLNPHAGDGGVLGKEEEEIISPAIKELADKGVLCYGPYPVDGFMGSGSYSHFDGVLAMYHDQGLAPFKALAMEEGVNYTAGLPVVRTSPAHGTAYDIVGKGVANESSFREAIYQAIDIFRSRCREKTYHAHPLRKQYFDKNDDSDKLKLDTPDDDTEL